MSHLPNPERQHRQTQEKMTLNRLLLLFLGSLLGLLLAGNVLLNISVTRDYLQDQLLSHAQDAATSLGLSLSSVIDARDLVAAERMIDAIYDSGSYRRIVMFDVADKALITRYGQVSIEGVPLWFTQVITLETPVAEAQVMAGWTQLGTLRVESHPGYAYQELWHSLKTQVLLFVLVFFIGMLMIQGFVSMLLLPLKRIERQASEMSQNRFDYRAPTPGTRELASVAQAMNGMADKLGAVFAEQVALIEDLRSQSYHDALTGLLNREGFDQRLRAELEARHSVPHGSLLLLQLNQFAELNQQQGRDKGDEVLKAVAEVLARVCAEHRESFAARRSGAGFSAFLPNLGPDQLDGLADKLLARLIGLPLFKNLLHDNLVHVGLACARETDDCRALLSKADLALRQAQGRGQSGWQRYADSASASVMEEVRQASEWQSILQDVLARRSIHLHVQPVFRLPRATEPGRVEADRAEFYQVLARIEVAGRLVPARIFLPMAERFGLMTELDQLVLQLVLEFLNTATDRALCLSVALSETSLADARFLDWLHAQLARAGSLATRLRFDVPEYGLIYHEQAISRLCLMGRQYGFAVSIDRFGVGSVPYSYLQRLPLAAIRIDPSFVRTLETRPENQFFLRMAAQMAHSQSIQVVGVGVETEAEWQALRNLGIDMAMGYFWGQPEESSSLLSSEKG